MKNSKLLKSCLALSMVFGTNGYLMTNISAEGEAEETLDPASVSTTSNSSEGQDETNAESQNIGGDQTSSQTATDYSSLITDSLTYNEDKTIAVLTICVNTTDSVTLDFSNSDDLTESMTNSNYAINNELTNGTTTYAFNIAKNGTYNFDAIVLDAEENIVGTKSFTENVTELTDTGEIQSEYSQEMANTFTFKANITHAEAQEVAYYYWHTASDTENVTTNDFKKINASSSFDLDDYSTDTQDGYIVFLIKPNEGYLFTGLDADGNGDFYVVGSNNYGNIAKYPGLSNVMTVAQNAGYVAVFGYKREANSTGQEIEFVINTLKPSLGVEATVKEDSNVKIGDEITFNVILKPTVDHENAKVIGVTINSNASATTEEELKEVTTINGVAVDPSKISALTENTDGTYSATVKHTVTAEDFDEQHGGTITLNVNASVTYAITVESSAKDEIKTTSTVTETGTADPAPTITLKSLDLYIGNDKLSNTETSVTNESKVYDGTALNPSVTVKDGDDTVADDITTKYYVKNANGYYENVGETAPSLKDADSKSVKVVVSKTGYADSVGYYTLEVKERPVTFTGNSGTKIYNGQTQTVTGFADTSTGENTGLVSGHTATMDARVSGKDVSATPYSGTITNANEVVIKDASDNVVTSNYKITTTPGTLTITGQSINSKKEDGTDDPAYNGVTVTAPSDTVYNGQSQKLKPTVKDANNNPLTEGTDYELEYSKDTTNVGPVTVTIKGKGNYTGTITTTYQITSATGLNVTAPTGDDITKTYDGNALNPSAKASIDGAKITYYTKNESGEWAEYGTTAPSITNVGSLDVKVIATKTGYEPSEATYTLTVNTRSVTFTGQTATRTYTGSEIELTTVSTNGLVPGHTNNVSYSAKGTNVQAEDYQGTITNANEVVIKDASNNVVTSNYKITTTPGTLTITGQSINSKKEDGTDDPAYNGVTVTAPSDTVYNGQSQKLKPTVKDANNNPLTEGTDYELEYSKDTTNVGPVTVTIKGKGNYTGTITTTYQITPAPIVEDTETDTPRFTISEIDSVVYNGTSQKQAPVIKDGDKELKEGQDYKLTYSEDTTNAGEITVTIEGLGNYAGKVTKTYNILQKQVTVTVKDNSKVFGSKDPELKVDVKGYVEGEADKISCLVSRDVGEDVGKYDIVAHGKTSQGNYLVEYVPATFTITSQSISSEDKDSYGNVEIGTLNSVVYNGTSQKQAPVIKDGDKELKEGQDYKLTYSEDTTNAGEITVTIEGLGNYAGKVTKTYTIMKVNSSANVSGISSKYNGSNQILVTDAKVEGGTIYYSLDGKTYSTNMPEKKESGTYTIYYYVKGDKNHNDLGSESKPLTVEAKIVEEEKAESESKVKTSTATHTFFFESMGVAAAGLFIALRKRMNK